MANDPVRHEQVTLENSGDSVRINVGNLWVNVSRTDEGVVADIFDGEESDSIASTYASFDEVAPEDEDWTRGEENDLIGSQDVDSDPYDVDDIPY